MHLQASQDFSEVKLARMRAERCFFARKVGMFSCRGRGGVLVLYICTEVSAGKAKLEERMEVRVHDTEKLKPLLGQRGGHLPDDEEEQRMFYHPSPDNYWLRRLNSQTYCDCQVLEVLLYFLHSFSSIFHSERSTWIQHYRSGKQKTLTACTVCQKSNEYTLVSIPIEST